MAGPLTDEPFWLLMCEWPDAMPVGLKRNLNRVPKNKEEGAALLSLYDILDQSGRRYTFCGGFADAEAAKAEGQKRQTEMDIIYQQELETHQRRCMPVFSHEVVPDSTFIAMKTEPNSPHAQWKPRRFYYLVAQNPGVPQ